MKIVFMGTPDFTIPILDSIKKAGHEIVLVVTQPDKPRGRKKELMPPPAKVWAIENGIPVFQPERIKREEAVNELKKYPCDVCVVAAFGQILSKEILDMPRLGCVNVHASLLPKYRGAAPIQWAILNGDKITGVTTMQMGVGLDDGDMLLQKRVAISPKETGGSLFDKLAIEGGSLIVETLKGLEEGSITPIPQNEEEATHVGMIKKELGNLDFTKSAKVLSNYVKGLNPWPCAYTFCKGKMLKIWAAEAVDFDSKKECGEVILPDKNTLYIQTKDGVLSVLEIQAEGKKRMPISDFLRGNHLEAGDICIQNRG
ncbi:MAG: methionyl-tRNA formyltransferase [Lachnospiraceae bacterium]|nr:methionyl-tRNA formyltransferase [Lachnospiraceae bacterium]